MNYKIKSLIYLICFIASALIYNQLSEARETKKEVVAVDSTQTTPEVITTTDYTN